MKIEIWPIDRPVPYSKNPRHISEEGLAKVAVSLKEFGFRQPIVVDRDGIVVVGHARLRAARSLGIVEVPVHVADLTPEQAKAYRLADNRTNEEAVWWEEYLRDELVELQGLGVDVDLTGFDDREVLERLLPRHDDDAIDEVPAVPAAPVSLRGDVWLLGAHRITCGDSTVAEDVARALGGAKPHLMVTDPPYGVKYDPEWRNRADRAAGKPYGDRAVGQVDNDDRSDWAEAYRHFPGDVAYVWHPAGARQVEFFNSLVAAGFEIRMQIVWVKNVAPINRGHFHVRHEPCWYAVRKGKTAHWQGACDQNTVWEIAKNRANETGHSTQKPVECMRRPIENNSAPGEAVYDPFLGSGTTVIAAEVMGRVCHGLELNPAYVDVICRRFEDFTGRQVVLEGDGRDFQAVAEDRLGSEHGRHRAAAAA